MNTWVDKKKTSLVRRISWIFGTAILIIHGMVLLTFCFINLNHLYSHTLVDMANRVAMQFQDSMVSPEIESAFLDSRTDVFLRQLDDLNKYARPENVRVYVVFPNGVTSQYDPEVDQIVFKLLPPQLIRVLKATKAADDLCTEFPGFQNGFRSWIVSVPIRSANGSTGGMVMTSIYTEDVISYLMPSFAAVGICIVLSAILLYRARQSFAVILKAPLDNITYALENWSINGFDRGSTANRRDEIGRLSHALVEVADRLEAEKISRDKDEENRRNFFFNVSHELRTPVASLRAQAELLTDGLYTPEELPRYHQGILQEARHIQDMVEDLLTLSRLQNPGYTMDMEVCCLSEIVGIVYTGMTKVAGERDIRLSVEQKLPPEKTLVEGNYTRIRQLIMIFLENAIKYSESGTEIHMILEEEAGQMVLRIRDQGCGIPEDEIENVFQFQYRASNAMSKEGTGLGLAIAREISNRLKFRMAVESKVDQGTTISVFMPRVEA